LANLFPEYQLHYLYEYHDILASNGDGEPYMFFYQDEGKSFIHTFLKKRIIKVGKTRIDNCFDIQVFGYIGPISNSTDHKFNFNAYQTFSNWCREQNIISEFIRFNPFLSNHNLLIENNIQVIKLKQFTYLDLTLPEEILFNRISDRTKRYLLKAQREFGNQISVCNEMKDLLEFFDLYKSHMKKKDADPYYLFSDKYYIKLSEFVKHHGFLIYSCIGKKMVAGVVGLFLNNYSYLHHAARDVSVKESSLIYKYLYWRAMMIAKEKNMKACLIGGGITDRTDDPLLQFKMLYNPSLTYLYIGKAIHHQQKYDWICSIWEKEFPELVQKYSNFVDKYRFTID
jgi:hypothetical protein